MLSGISNAGFQIIERNSFWILIFLFLIACKDKNKEVKEDIDPSQYEEALVEANKYLLKTEEEQIADFLARYNWDMKETGSGLRYLIYHHGNGERAKLGKIAMIKYEIRLITGDIVYSSDNLGIKEFEIGKGDVESGLHEGIQLLCVGDKAKMILPSHLAFGLAGDHQKIPTRATLIYDIELLAVK